VHLDTIALCWIQRYIVTASRVDRARVYKVLMEMVHKFEDVTFHRPRDGDIVDQAQVDDIFAEPNATCVWADRYAEFGSHEKDAEDFADTCQTAGIDLAYVNGLGLQELLEDHAIVGMLSCGNTDAMRFQRLANGGVA